MTLNTSGVLNAVVSHAMATGLFERVNQHEPKSKPGKGLTAAVWVDRIAPHAAASGLAVTSARLTLRVRLYTNMLADPQDSIDPNLAAAADALINAYSGDFTLGGLGRNVDLLGEGGVGLSAQAGYLNQDGALFRVMDLTVPVIISDVWTQDG